MLFVYLDPGTGSMIMSALIALVAAVGMAGKTYWYKIKSLLTGRDDPADPDPGSPSAGN